MPKFAVVMKENGEGCDYTIGCGMKLIEIQATSRDDALVEARAVVQGTPNDDYAYGYEDTMLMDSDHESVPRLAYAKLVQIEEELPVVQWHAEIVASYHRRKTESATERERQEYERLKTKFG